MLRRRSQHCLSGLDMPQTHELKKLTAAQETAGKQLRFTDTRLDEQARGAGPAGARAVQASQPSGAQQRRSRPVHSCQPCGAWLRRRRFRRAVAACHGSSAARPASLMTLHVAPAPDAAPCPRTC